MGYFNVGWEKYMFGYVKPQKDELLVREYEFYKAAYCGICRAMKQHTGYLSNVTLSYDSVFLALVRMLYIEDDKFSARSRRCIAHPFTKRPMLEENEALVYTARAFAILTYYKLRDDIDDERGLRRLLSRAVYPVVSHSGKRANLSSLAMTVSEKLAEIRGLEDARCDSVDKPASLFGELLGEIFAYGLLSEDRLVPYTLGYHLGKFIFALDAADDYEDDRKAGKYNPYVIYYQNQPLTKENKQTIKCALLLECKKIESAVNLLPFGKRATIENIVNNIIYLGLVKRMEFLDSEQETLKEKEN